MTNRISLTLDSLTLDQMRNAICLLNPSVNFDDITPNDIAKEALGLYLWFLEKSVTGKAIVAADKALSQLDQVATQMVPARAPKI